MRLNLIIIKNFRIDYFDFTSTCRVNLTLKIMLSVEFIIFAHCYRLKRTFSYLNIVDSNSNNCEINFSHSEIFNYTKTYFD